MAVRLGLQCKAYLKRGGSSWQEVGNLRNVTLNLEKGEADITTRAANGWKLTVGTLKEGSVETEMVWDGDDLNFVAIKDAYFNDTSVEMAFLDGPNVAPSQGLYARFSVTNLSRDENLEEAVLAKVTLKPTYDATLAPTWATAPLV
jgi:TP901-1 family phage major tail protein